MFNNHKKLSRLISAAVVCAVTMYSFNIFAYAQAGSTSGNTFSDITITSSEANTSSQTSEPNNSDSSGNVSSSVSNQSSGVSSSSNNTPSNIYTSNFSIPDKISDCQLILNAITSDNSPVSGIEFDLYDDNNIKVTSEKTNDQGTIIFSNLNSNCTYICTQTTNNDYYKSLQKSNSQDILIENKTETINFLYEKIKDDFSENYKTGEYTFVSSIDGNKALDVNGASISDGANIDIYSANNTAAQKFSIIHNDNEYYQIQNVNSGLFLTVANNSSSNGENIIQSSWTNSDSQLWRFEKNSDNTYTIISKIGTVIDLDGANTSDGTNIDSYTSNQTNAQKWKLVHTSDLNNGLYNFYSYLDNNKVLDIDGASVQNNANLQLYSENGSNAQIFDVYYAYGGYYKIKNINSGLLLDVYNASSESGANIQQYEENGSDAQLWSFEQSANGTYTIYSKLGTVIDLYGANPSDGTNIDSYAPNNTDAQKWILDHVSDFGAGTYTIASSIDSDKVLDIDGASIQNGANLQLYSSNHSDAQQFNIIHDYDQYYKIVNVNSGKLLDVYNASSENGTNIQQYEENGSDAQLWRFKKNSDGTYTIFSKLGTVLDLSCADTGNGTNIDSYDYNGTNAQKWNFINLSDVTYVKNGIYTFGSAIDPERVIDIDGGSCYPTSNAQIYTSNNTAPQKFSVEFIKDDYYKITNVNSGLVLDVYGGSAADGTNVDQYRWNGSDAQLWRFQKNSDETYTIFSKLGTVLDLNGANTNDGSNIQTYTSNGTQAQSWVLSSPLEVSDGVYSLVCSIDNNMVIDVDSASYDDSANIQLYSSNGSDAQKFYINYYDAGYYKIMSVNSGKSLDVSYGSPEDCANVEQYEWNGSDAQLWKFIKNSNGTYTIQSKLGTVIDLDSANTNNGANIETYSSNGTAAQQWILKQSNIPCSAYIPVNVVYQNPQLPTGCEATSLTAVLNYLGYNADKEDIADNYMPKGPYLSDYRKVYVGDPHDPYGKGCYAGPIVQTANKYLSEANSSYRAYDVSGSSLETLYNYVANGTPVIIWGILYGKDAYYSGWWCNGEYLRWLDTIHICTLDGYDYSDNTVSLADPIEGQLDISMERMQYNYNAADQQAVILVKQ